MINAEFKDAFNNAVTIRIGGVTPAIREGQPDPFIIKDCSIAYNDNSLKPGVNDYKGSIAFVGSFNDYRAFGVIGHKTHEVTVTSAGMTFRGFLLPEVYDMEYTGHSVPFTLNFESMLGQLERTVFDEPTNLYSIEDIVNKVASITGCTVDYSLSFSESLSMLKVYSANFINDDNNKENYMKILEWIACTFGLRVTLWGTLLTLYSCERMRDVDNLYPSLHYGIDETVSVNEQCDTCAVQVNNYALPEIPDDFSLEGARKLLDQPPMKIRQGKKSNWSDVGSDNIYYRQIYEYQPNQKVWNFNKYDASNNLVDEFDESKYIIGGVPLAGAYPIAWGRVTSSGQFGGMEQAIWFKRHN
jgi:hypothetical protein